MEVASAIIGVIVGFLLSTGWEFWKDSQADKKTRTSIRALLTQEIKHNTRSLVAAREAYAAAAGDSTMELQVMQRFYGYHLSQDAWVSQMEYAHLALSRDEMLACYDFYGRLRSTIAAADRFHSFDRYSVPHGALAVHHSLCESVIAEIDAALAAAPSVEE